MKLETIPNQETNENAAESFQKYFKEKSDQFYKFQYGPLNDAVQSVRRQQGVEDPRPFEPLPDETFIEHNGSILVASKGDYFWTRGQEKVAELKALGLTQGDSGVGVPFANALPEDFKWKGMQNVVEATNRAQKEQQAMRETRSTGGVERQAELAEKSRLQSEQDSAKAAELLKKMSPQGNAL